MSSEPAAWRKTGLQFILFNMVGLLNTAIDVAVFSLLLAFSVHASAAQAIGYMAGMLNSYLLNSRFTFKQQSQHLTSLHKGARRIRFIIWNLSMLLLSVVLMAIAIEWLHMNAAIAKIGVTLSVLFINFYGNKRWVFIKQPIAEEGEGKA